VNAKELLKYDAEVANNDDDTIIIRAIKKGKNQGVVYICTEMPYERIIYCLEKVKFMALLGGHIEGIATNER
jgi:hypothetical protein